jgi:predicted secreted protein
LTTEFSVRDSPTLLGLAFAATLLTTTAQAAEPAATPTPATASAAQDRMQQIVCRKDKVIGSLVSTKKTCHSRAQWAYIDDTNQAFSRDLVDSTRTRQGGN